MSLSPSRSFRSLADSPIPRAGNSSSWLPKTGMLRAAFPAFFALIFAASIYFYTQMTAQVSLGSYLVPSIDLSTSSASFVSRQWLQAQVKQSAEKGTSYHPEVSNEELMEVDPFSPHSGINVWDYYPPQLSCPDLQRIGKTGEGGKWVCGMTHLSREEQCVMYSFGISTDISFEVEILLRTSCIIHAFDPTVGRLPFHRLKEETLVALTPAQRGRIRFHKAAMGTRSGSSEVHSFNEQLYDIMHSLGHSFIHLLKVDIEGGEWAVFNSLFAEKAHYTGRSSLLSDAVGAPSLPVGQLIIELHYNSMRETEDFFVGAQKLGLLPFSREINLQPCINGGKPVAAEYSFIHAELFYVAEQRPQQVPPAHTASWHAPLNAVIYFLTQRSRVARMSHALSLLYENFWRDYPHYPIVIFHDDLRPIDEQRLQQAVPGMPLRFIPITLSLPENLKGSNVVIPERTKCSPGSSTIGYRHMCRFHATLVHKYLSDLGYAHFDYIMRLDDDSLITSPVGYDLFRYMRENKKQYGFVNMVADEPACVEGLWVKSEQFYNTSSAVATAKSRRKQTLKKSVVGLGNSNSTPSVDEEDELFRIWPRGAVFYNNFEISSFGLWRSPVWRAYMDFIDQTGGIYTVRWGDAPLHTIGVTMVLARDEIHAFRDIAYRHEPFVDQVPSGLPMPHMDPFLGPEVECRYYDKWMCFYTHGQHNVSFNGTFNSTASLSFNASHPLFRSLETVSPLQRIYYVNHTAIAPIAVAPAAVAAGVATGGSEDTAVSRERSVLYTFAHSGREELLVATLRSLYEKYLARFPAAVVVFYSERGAFKVNSVRAALAHSPVLSLVSFRPVVLPDSAAYTQNAVCVANSEEVRGSSLFLRHDAMATLKALGYTWLLRFGDDSYLRDAVTFNLFERVHSSGALFGYQLVWGTKEECAADLWDLGQRLCGNATAFGARRLRKGGQGGRQALTVKNMDHTAGTHLDSQCSPMFAQWAPLNVFVTGFSVSHVSVWDSLQCRRLVRAVTATPTNPAPPLWSDAAIHTLCVVSSLQPAQITQLKDFGYKFNWTRVEAAPDPRNRINLHQTTPVAEYDRAFEIQRLGWMGGDVAASAVLPDPANALDPATRRVIWLFGDSIIGVSNQDRRIKDYSTMVSNTVATMTVRDTPDASHSDGSCAKPVETLDYHWRTNAEGLPQAIFSLPTRGTCATGQQRVWPIAAVSVVIADGTVRLAVLAQVLCLAAGATAESLQFRQYETALVLVRNPNDPPRSWRYEAQYFPNSLDATIHWIAVAGAKGAPFAQHDEDLYLLGAFHRQDHAVGNAGHQVIGRVPAQRLLELDIAAVEVMVAATVAVPPPSSAPWMKLYQQGPLTAGWSMSAEAKTPHALFGPLLSEASLHYDSRLREWLVVSLLLWEDRVQVCRTPSIEAVGTWNCSYVARVSSDDKLIMYAAKAHPHLRSDNCAHRPQPQSALHRPMLDLIVSYVSNTMDSTSVLYEPQYRSAYTPRFIRIQEITL